MNAARGAEVTQVLPALWVAVGVILLLGVFAAVMIEVGTRRQRREMDRLADAMWEADRAWRRAMIDYLTDETRPKPRVKPVTAPPEAITVELEVIKLDDGEGKRK